MKVEINETKPAHFTESWPGQYRIFSHYECVCGVPSVMFLITTLKENGAYNACLHAWSTFAGDRGGFFAVMAGLMQDAHTYRNILRDREFCVNFLSADYYDNCIRTIEQNGDETDEIAAGGFTAEPARLIRSPRIREAFLVYECTLESYTDLSGEGISSTIIGRVRHAAVTEERKDVDAMCGERSFMFNIHSPKDPRTGEGERSAVAKLEAVRYLNE